MDRRRRCSQDQRRSGGVQTHRELLGHASVFGWEEEFASGIEFYRMRCDSILLSLVIEAVLTQDLPVLKSVYCCGFLYRTSSQMVLYQRPKAASFLSDQPFSFDWSKFWSSSAKPSARVKPTDLQFVLRQINSSAKLNAVLEKVLRSSNPPCVVSQALIQEAESEHTDRKALESTVGKRISIIGQIHRDDICSFIAGNRRF